MNHNKRTLKLMSIQKSQIITPCFPHCSPRPRQVQSQTIRIVEGPGSTLMSPLDPNNPTLTCHAMGYSLFHFLNMMQSASSLKFILGHCCSVRLNSVFASSDVGIEWTAMNY